MAEAAEEVARGYGIKAEYRGGSYDRGSFSPRIKFTVPAVVSEERKDEFAVHVGDLGGEASWFGKTFRDGRKEFRVEGINMRRSKNCVDLLEVATGKKYKCPLSYVRRFLGSERKTG